MDLKEKQWVTSSFLNSVGSVRLSVEEILQNQDILVKILVRLPVKSLLQMCCVCKSWYSLISSSYFISLHTHFKITNGHSDFSIMNSRCHIIKGHSKDYSRVLFNFVYVDDDDKNSIRYQKAYCPVGINLDGYMVIGCCYGLVCLCKPFKFESSKPIVLWNPSVGKFITLPYYENQSATSETFVGFGFDFKRFDYKVVRVVYEKCGGPTLRDIDIFELSVGVWRSIKNKFPPSTAFTLVAYSRPVFLNGAIHWIGYTTNGSWLYRKPMIVVFDVANEDFRVMDVPNEINVRRDQSHVTISTLGNSICLIHKHKREFHIWIMEEYGIAASWTRLYNIRPPNRDSSILYGYKSGEVLLITSDSKLFLYNPKGKTFRFLEVYGASVLIYLNAVYMEVLPLWKR